MSDASTGPVCSLTDLLGNLIMIPDQEESWSQYEIIDVNELTQELEISKSDPYSPTDKPSQPYGQGTLKSFEDVFEEKRESEWLPMKSQRFMKSYIVQKIDVDELLESFVCELEGCEERAEIKGDYVWDFCNLSHARQHKKKCYLSSEPGKLPPKCSLNGCYIAPNIRRNGKEDSCCGITHAELAGKQETSQPKSCGLCGRIFGYWDRKMKCHCCKVYFCDTCTSRTCPVTALREKGQGRTCDDCFHALPNSDKEKGKQTGILKGVTIAGFSITHEMGILSVQNGDHLYVKTPDGSRKHCLVDRVVDRTDEKTILETTHVFECVGDNPQNAELQRKTLEEFMGRNTLRCALYGQGFRTSSIKAAGTSFSTNSVSALESSVRAKRMLEDGIDDIEWISFQPHSFVYYCKTGKGVPGPTECQVQATTLSVNASDIQKHLIHDWSEVKPGDHVCVKRVSKSDVKLFGQKAKNGLYSHHMIIKDDTWCIEFSAPKEGIIKRLLKGVIQKTEYKEQYAKSLKNDMVYLVSYTKSFPPEVVVEKAVAKLYEKHYNLFTWNCEHFATECKTGKRISFQIRELVTSIIGVTISAIPRTIVSTGVAFLGAIAKQHIGEGFGCAFKHSVKELLELGIPKSVIKHIHLFKNLGIATSALIETVDTTIELLRYRQEYRQGTISKKEYYRLLSKRLTAAPFRAGGAIGGFLVGAIFITFPGASLVGGLVGYVAGWGVGKVVGYGVGKAYDKLAGAESCFCNGCEALKTKQLSCAQQCFSCEDHLVIHDECGCPSRKRRESI